MMAEGSMTSVRPDIDIRADIYEIVVHYPPLAADRQYIDVQVEGGRVILSGNVSNPINRRYLVDRAATVPGVTAVDAERLADDISINIAAGRLLPPGMVAHSHHGTVVLSGSLPEGIDLDAVANRVAALPGVRRVIVSLR